MRNDASIIPRKRVHGLASMDWRDRAYEESLEASLRGLEERRRIDPSFALEDAEGTLRHLYILEGNDWCSRGMLQDAVIAAQIAAHEEFIEAWKKEST
jgi:hypothetical protein